MVPWGRGASGACRSPDMLTLESGGVPDLDTTSGLEGWVYAAWTQDKEAPVWSRMVSLQSWTRRTTSRLSTTAAHGSPRCRGGSSRLWVRQRLILSPLVSTLLDADDPVTKLAQYQGSSCVVPSVHGPMIN